MQKRKQFINHLENALSCTCFTTRTLTDLYNKSHATSFSEKNLVLVETSIRELTAIGQLGFGTNEFGIVVYSLQEKNATFEVNWGVATSLIDSDSWGNQSKVLSGVPFDSIKQTSLKGLYAYYLLKFV